MTAPRKNTTLITIAVIAAFAGFLLWTTFSAQKAQCEVCVDFNGRRNCATASAASEADAARAAQNTACGPIANGMDESIKCDNVPPASKTCKGG